MFKLKKDRLNLLLLILILLFSSIFRITNLDLIEFKSDEAANILLSSRQIFGEQIPPGGTGSSLGILNPPLFNYLILPITFFTLDPQNIVLVIALLNVLAIVGFYLIVKKYYSQNIAFTSSLLIALSPWAILFSRKIWMQDLLIPFFIPVFLSIHKIIIDKKEIYWGLYSAFSLFLIQLHQASIFFLAPLTLFLLLQTRRISIKYLSLGALIGLLPLLPYFFYEINNGCPDCSAILSSSQKLVSPSFEIFQRPLQILGQGNFDFILGQNGLKAFSQNYSVAFELRKILYLFYVLIPISAIIFLKTYKNLSLLVYLLLVVCLIYFVLKIEPQMHYFILFIPILALFLGGLFNWSVKRGKGLKIAATSLFIVILLSSLLFNYSFFDLIKKNNGADGDYGAVYSEIKRKTDKELKEFSGRKDYEEIFNAYHVPLKYTFGFMPLSQMLYFEISEGNLSHIEKDLQESPRDPRLSQKLLAYHTQKEPDIETIKLLKEKKEDISHYEKIYDEILGYYKSRNFLKEYRSERHDVGFFYPEHWKVQENSTGIILNSDNYSILIKRNGSVDVGCMKGTCDQKEIEKIKSYILE